MAYETCPCTCHADDPTHCFHCDPDQFSTDDDCIYAPDYCPTHIVGVTFRAITKVTA